MSEHLHEEQPLDDYDFDLMAELRAIVEAGDPPPSGLADRVKFELSWAALEAEVAQLQVSELVGVRSEEVYASTDTITFTSSSVSLMIRVSQESAQAETRRVDGWLTESGVHVDLLVDGRTFVTKSDENGRLVWEGIPTGMAKFFIHLDTAVGQPVITPAVQV